ncbi:MAG TPA: hypothetical protein VHH73_06590 [Verrucomicrobiae bacterium]|nr:hypothetical protein [Verrucomicrobiae bacterium]
MKKNPKKDPKQIAESQLLELLKQVLPKATHDAQLAGKIYAAIENELRTQARATAFEKYCARVPLTDLEDKTVMQVEKELKSSFAAKAVAVEPSDDGKSLAVEVTLPDGTQFTSEIKVNPNATAAVEGDDEQEIKFKFVPFPVCLPGDKELVWSLAKRETMTPEEAGIALSKLEEDFWASKTGQKLLKDRVERCFPEFISRVPGGMLSEVGLKRHYKTPEPVKILRPAPGKR